MNQKQKPISKASMTPRCDELERQRRALEQGRTAAYGDALALAKRLERECAHWKANHDAQVERARILVERTDMPLERVQAYKQIGAMQAELDRLNLELGNPIDRVEWAKHQVPAKIPCASCGCETNAWNVNHKSGCAAQLPF